MAKENGHIELNENDGSTGKLPVELWTPTKINKDNKDNKEYSLDTHSVSSNESIPTKNSNKDASDSPTRKHSEKKKLSYEEIIQQLEEKVKVRPLACFVFVLFGVSDYLTTGQISNWLLWEWPSHLGKI